MRYFSNLSEMTIGAIIFGIGLLYLSSQDRVTERLIDVATERALEEENLHQLNNEIDMDKVPDEELYAIVMGYREYPITIDGHVIPPNGYDYESYFGFIRNGVYIRRYIYDVQHNIVQIDFTYSGT